MGELADLVAAAGMQPRAHAYGADPEQVADLLLPATEGPHPVVVLLHGGFWRARFDRSLMAALAVDLADRGWASWNVEYRRVGNGGGVPETLDDVRGGHRGAAGNCTEPIVAGRVVVIGHSAGGQLGHARRRRPGRGRGRVPGRCVRPGVGIRRGHRRQRGSGVRRCGARRATRGLPPRGSHGADPGRSAGPARPRRRRRPCARRAQPPVRAGGRRRRGTRAASCSSWPASITSPSSTRGRRRGRRSPRAWRRCGEARHADSLRPCETPSSSSGAGSEA